MNVKTFGTICQILFVRLARYDIHFTFGFLSGKLNRFVFILFFLLIFFVFVVAVLCCFFLSFFFWLNLFNTREAAAANSPSVAQMFLLGIRAGCSGEVLLWL